MSLPQVLSEFNISATDWSATPQSVQSVVLNLLSTQRELENRLALVEEHLNQNSENSSRSSSREGFDKKPAKKPSHSTGTNGRKRGGQSGHKGHHRHLYDVSSCQSVTDHYPSFCHECGTALSGTDEMPYRHQCIEIPPLELEISEHRLHALDCPHCGHRSRARLPQSVASSPYGERLCGLVSWLSSDYRHSHRQLQQLLERLWGLKISVSSINGIRRQMGQALESIVAGAHQYLLRQEHLHSDETSFLQHNGDGENPTGTKGWLWALVGKLVSVFHISLSRAQKVAQQMLSETYDGIVISDRYSSYNWLDVHKRQVCWAHLKRDFTAIAQRRGVSQNIGEALLKRQRWLFRWWSQVRNGAMSWEHFQLLVQLLRKGLKAQLEAAAELDIGAKEKSPLAKTVRTCRKMLKLEPALWTFAYHRGGGADQ